MQRNKKLDDLVYELQVLRGFSENILQRIGFVNGAITEFRLATSTLEGIGKKEVGGSILVPIGGGAYIRARSDDTERLIVGIGASVSMEKTIEEAKEFFQIRIIELEKARASLQQQLDETATRMDGIQREVKKILQPTSGEPNVRRT